MFKTNFRNKLIAFLLAAMLVPSVISIAASYFFISSSVTRDAVSSSTDLLFQGKTNIENYLSQLQKASLAVYNDPDLFELLDNPDNQAELNTSWQVGRNRIFRAMQSISYSVFEIRQVYLYLEESKRSFAVFENYFAYNRDPLSKYISPHDEREQYLEPPHPIHSYGLTHALPYPDDQVFTYYRTVYNSLTKQRLGTIALDVSPGFIASLCAQLYKPGKEEVYLLDDAGNMLYPSADSGIRSPLTAEWVGELSLLTDNSGSFDWKRDGFSGLILYEKLETPVADLTLVKLIPYGMLNSSARQLTTLNTALYSFSLIIALAATVWISFRFTNPIRRLAGYMSRIREGDLNVDIDIKGSDELAMLGRRFRSMMDKINDLILREYQLGILNKTNELKALQAQVNPHFLNNALQSIGTLALQHNDRKIYSLISSLGKMMRYSMNTNESVVTLGEEIDYIKAYLDLQRQRFGEDFVFQLELAPAMAAVHIPKMTLQPLVENYFKHAFAKTAERRELTVRCYFDGGEAVIEVADNGPGADPDVLEKLMQEASRNKERKDGIGLSNVRSRLELFYEGTARMELRNMAPRGFCVAIRIAEPPASAGTKEAGPNVGNKEEYRDEDSDRG